MELSPFRLNRADVQRIKLYSCLNLGVSNVRKKTIIYHLLDLVAEGAVDKTDDGETMHSVPWPAMRKLSQAIFFGQVKPNRCIRGRHPRLTLIQRSLHGLNGAMQDGAYNEHRKRDRSGEQPIFTRGKNWWTSKAASSCLRWLKKLGNSVIL